MTADTLERRLAAFRGARRREAAAGLDGGGDRLLAATGSWPPVDEAAATARRLEAAERLAAAVGGEPAAGPHGSVIRREPDPIDLPVDRRRLAGLPGHPGPDVPLVCLDTETTGLGTATGTVAWLIGLGWWEGRLFRQQQLMLPDHADEPALLAALEAVIPADCWLVTYNGRGFDWPLLVTRYRLARRPAPCHAGMLDLLPHVRRLFRYRLGDARLATVEREMLGVIREDDVAGWEIPGRYLAFLRDGDVAPLLPVIAHNVEDVRSLGRLLVHLDVRYADPVERRSAPAGDLLGLARGFTRERRHEDALACLDEADAGWRPPAFGSEAWPFGARSPAPGTIGRARIRAERARTLSRLGRTDDALAVWESVATGGSRSSARAWVECAKIHEHRRGDHAAALRATEAAGRALERERALGRPDPAEEAALAGRRRRLRLRLRRVG
jgi:uncharacterized protein